MGEGDAHYDPTDDVAALRSCTTCMDASATFEMSATSVVAHQSTVLENPIHGTLRAVCGPISSPPSGRKQGAGNVTIDGPFENASGRRASRPVSTGAVSLNGYRTAAPVVHRTPSSSSIASNGTARTFASPLNVSRSNQRSPSRAYVSSSWSFGSTSHRWLTPARA